jgi:hypothetical protein
MKEEELSDDTIDILSVHDCKFDHIQISNVIEKKQQQSLIN